MSANAGSGRPSATIDRAGTPRRLSAGNRSRRVPLPMIPAGKDSGDRWPEASAVRPWRPCAACQRFRRASRGEHRNAAQPFDRPRRFRRTSNAATVGRKCAAPPSDDSGDRAPRRKPSGFRSKAASRPPPLNAGTPRNRSTVATVCRKRPPVASRPACQRFDRPRRFRQAVATVRRRVEIQGDSRIFKPYQALSNFAP